MNPINLNQYDIQPENELIDDEFTRSKLTGKRYWFFCKKCGDFLGSDKLKTPCLKCLGMTKKEKELFDSF